MGRKHHDDKPEGTPREAWDSPIALDVAPDESYETAEPLPDSARAIAEDELLELLEQPEGTVIEAVPKVHLPGHMQEGEYFEVEPGKRVQIMPDGLPPKHMGLWKPGGDTQREGYAVTQLEKARFIRVLSETGSVNLACRALGRAKMTMYNHRHRDPRFAELWDKALEVSVVNLEDEARRRAMAGSDLLLIFLLKGLKRRIYGDRPPGATNIMFGPDGRPAKLEIAWGDAPDVPLERVEREDGPKFLSGPASNVIDAEFTVELPDKAEKKS